MNTQLSLPFKTLFPTADSPFVSDSNSEGTDSSDSEAQTPAPNNEGEALRNGAVEMSDQPVGL